ncbi:MAG: DNA methyltransferase [Elusimicrobiota bacterium]
MQVVPQNYSFNVLIKRKKETYKNIENNTISLPNNTIPHLLLGDVFEQLRRIPDKSISVVVTSPPYWNLRDYEIENQIGREKSPQEYVGKMIRVGDEILRVLKDDGAYFLNIGDTYVDKNLQMIPSRIAIGMQNMGWLLRNQIIWYKPDHMPSPVRTRFTNTYEPVFFFTKNDWEKNVCFDIDSIRIPHKTQKEIQMPKGKKYNGKFRGNEKNIGASPGARMSISEGRYTLKRKHELSLSEICDYLRYWREKKEISVKEIDKILGYKHTAGHWFRKDVGGSLPTPNDWLKLKKILNFDDRYDKEMTETHLVLQVVQNHPKGKNPGDLWIINTAKTGYEHFSVFPEEIPKMAIKSCCPSDGIVLDPFAGSGTTGKVALELNRKSILIELQSKFVKIIKKRCGEIKII